METNNHKHHKYSRFSFTSTDNSTLIIVHVSVFHSRVDIENETFESTAVLAGNLRTGVQDSHAEHSIDSVTGVRKTSSLSVKM